MVEIFPRSSPRFIAGSVSDPAMVEADLRRPELAALLGLDGSVGPTDILAAGCGPSR